MIQLWLRAGDPLARALVSKGYRVIVSTKDAWYMDHGFGNWKGNSTSGYGYHPWQVSEAWPWSQGRAARKVDKI